MERESGYTSKVRRSKARFLISLVTAAAAVASLLICFRLGSGEPLEAQDPTPAPPSIDALADTPLRETVVLPTFACPLTAGKNSVWCGTFQLAWDHLKSDVVRQPVLIEGAEELSGRLNASPFPQDQLEPGTFYATAGKAEDGIVGTIRNDLKRLFPKFTPDLDDAQGAAIVAYAYLRAGIPFKIPYFEMRKPLPFRDTEGKTSPVKSFGIRLEDDYAYGKLRAQVEVLHVGESEERGKGFQGGYGQVIKEFVLDPDRGSAPFQLIIAKVPRKDTLAETWKDVVAKMGAPKRPYEGHPNLGCNELFLAPNIRLATTHHFRELEGKNRKLLNKGQEGLHVETALQTIRFVLNRGGAELESEAKKLFSPIPRYFVVDGPFLVVIRKRGATDPFFALWIETPELLEPWPEK